MENPPYVARKRVKLITDAQCCEHWSPQGPNHYLRTAIYAKCCFTSELRMASTALRENVHSWFLHHQRKRASAQFRCTWVVEPRTCRPWYGLPAPRAGLVIASGASNLQLAVFDQPISASKHYLESVSMYQTFNRSTWIWKTAEVICIDVETDRFVAFAQRNNINRVYIHINPDIPHKHLASFIAKCASSISFEALIGDPAWIKDPQSHQSLQLRLCWIREYQHQYARDVRFSLQGMHLDIEPWQLEDWRGPCHLDLVRQWVKCVQDLRDWAHAQQPPLLIVADLPFWMHTLQFPDTKERLDLVMMRILDGAVFMTYRNSPESLVSIASEALMAGWKCQKRRENIYLAVETVPSEEGNHISYHGMSNDRLNFDLSCLENGRGLKERLGHELWYGGLAVHEYHAWAAMES